MLQTLAAYLGLFVWSFLAATILPLSSEIPLLVLVRTEHTLVLPVLVATAGNYLGACTTYLLGRRAARELGRNGDWLRRDSGSVRAAWLFRRYGQPALLLSWVPVVGDALVALAGAIEVPLASFSCWVVLGKAVRYIVVAWLARLL